MLRISLVVILFQVVLQTGSEALCRDDIRSDIKYRTLVYTLLCSKHDPQLGSCCRVMEQEIRRQRLALKILCPNNETDHCKTNPCDFNAVCVSHSNHYTCTCKPGYTGPGTNCTKINYCSSNPCDVNAVCVSNTYNYICTCKPGYTRPGTNCIQLLPKIVAEMQKSCGYAGATREESLLSMRFSAVELIRTYTRRSETGCISLFSGNAGDSLAFHNQSDNDADGSNCATTWKGAWWYKSCHYSNLNGLYLGAGQRSSTGMKWHKWHSYSMKKTTMKIRPNQF